MVVLLAAGEWRVEVSGSWAFVFASMARTGGRVGGRGRVRANLDHSRYTS